MPSIAQIRQYLTLTVLPVLAGAGANWLLVHVHLLAAFHLSKGAVAAELTQLGVFAVSAGLAWLASHHILKGAYKPGAPAPAVASDLEGVLAGLVRKELDRLVAAGVKASVTATSPAALAPVPSPPPPAA